MPKAKTSYSFAARNAKFPHDDDILHNPLWKPGTPEYQKGYDRAQGEDAKSQRLRYLSIEEELERAYRYVFPSEENAAVFSLKFAEVIRAAGNAYEIFAGSCTPSSMMPPTLWMS
jgi:hypothetical protein